MAHTDKKPLIYCKTDIYFEQHDVTAISFVDKTSVLASLHSVSHCVINLLEIVGAKNNTCRFPECSLRVILVVAVV